MPLDNALTGHWDSSPFDHGVMEASELEFLDDGRGTGTVANALGDDATRFSWHCPEPGVLEVCDEYGRVERVRYAVVTAIPVYTTDPVPAVTFEPPLFFAREYARTSAISGQ
ncbi:hypothetical protein J2Z21_001115 [Streptomyces griseochromogenes]|uniref:Uncharacterized protein n=1 Tax=Streptomyces griseochromogenes TaxID=68214 RepID=A0A1B1AUB2_9ACTN|nr:hypothetical protein [Streptomyces griseochromogenes]ANP50168.1 hypothetical protein AVL59_11575 [Streptomyces griseochromogenes]MBP2048191.1 hypothetical protein [Streptomyces griseochromogenes]